MQYSILMHKIFSKNIILLSAENMYICKKLYIIYKIRPLTKKAFRKNIINVIVNKDTNKQ